MEPRKSKTPPHRSDFERRFSRVGTKDRLFRMNLSEREQEREEREQREREQSEREQKEREQREREQREREQRERESAEQERGCFRGHEDLSDSISHDLSLFDYDSLSAIVENVHLGEMEKIELETIEDHQEERAQQGEKKESDIQVFLSDDDGKEKEENVQNRERKEHNQQGNGEILRSSEEREFSPKMEEKEEMESETDESLEERKELLSSGEMTEMMGFETPLERVKDKKVKGSPIERAKSTFSKKSSWRSFATTKAKQFPVRGHVHVIGQARQPRNRQRLLFMESKPMRPATTMDTLPPELRRTPSPSPGDTVRKIFNRVFRPPSRPSVNSNLQREKRPNLEDIAPTLPKTDPPVLDVRLLETEVVNLNAFLSLLSAEFINLEAVRELSQRCVVPEEIRWTIWLLLMRVIPCQKSLWNQVLFQKRKQYWKLAFKHCSGVDWEDELNLGSRQASAEVLARRQIYMDSMRTFVSGFEKLFEQRFIRYLISRVAYVWEVEHPETNYFQGFSDICAPLLLCLISHSLGVSYSDLNQLPEEVFLGCLGMEAEIYWAMSYLLETMNHQFSIEAIDSCYPVRHLQDLIKRELPDIHEHFEVVGVDPLHYSYRWLLLLMNREFTAAEAIRNYDLLLSSLAEPRFHIFVAVAILSHFKKQLLEAKSFEGCMELLHELPFNQPPPPRKSEKPKKSESLNQHHQFSEEPTLVPLSYSESFSLISPNTSRRGTSQTSSVPFFSQVPSKEKQNKEEENDEVELLEDFSLARRVGSVNYASNSSFVFIPRMSTNLDSSVSRPPQPKSPSPLSPSPSDATPSSPSEPKSPEPLSPRSFARFSSSTALPAPKRSELHLSSSEPHPSEKRIKKRIPLSQTLSPLTPLPIASPSLRPNPKSPIPFSFSISRSVFVSLSFSPPPSYSTPDLLYSLAFPYLRREKILAVRCALLVVCLSCFLAVCIYFVVAHFLISNVFVKRIKIQQLYQAFDQKLAELSSGFSRGTPLSNLEGILMKRTILLSREVKELRQQNLFLNHQTTNPSPAQASLARTSRTYQRSRSSFSPFPFRSLSPGFLPSPFPSPTPFPSSSSTSFSISSSSSASSSSTSSSSLSASSMPLIFSPPSPTSLSLSPSPASSLHTPSPSPSPSPPLASPQKALTPTPRNRLSTPIRSTPKQTPSPSKTQAPSFSPPLKNRSSTETEHPISPTNPLTSSTQTNRSVSPSLTKRTISPTPPSTNRPITPPLINRSISPGPTSRPLSPNRPPSPNRPLSSRSSSPQTVSNAPGGGGRRSVSPTLTNQKQRMSGANLTARPLSPVRMRTTATSPSSSASAPNLNFNAQQKQQQSKNTPIISRTLTNSGAKPELSDLS